jgi:hypothetical protein
LQAHSKATDATTNAGPKVLPLCKKTRPWANCGHTCGYAILALIWSKLS